jgi:excisionase family DNA binding protein
MAKDTQKGFTMFEKYQDVVGVDDLCLMLGGISRKLAYKLLKNGDIHSIRIGREYKIPKINVIGYLLQQDHNTIANNAEMC